MTFIEEIRDETRRARTERADKTKQRLLPRLREEIINAAKSGANAVTIYKDETNLVYHPWLYFVGAEDEIIITELAKTPEFQGFNFEYQYRPSPWDSQFSILISWD